jgi:hypothetical protein
MGLHNLLQEQLYHPYFVTACIWHRRILKRFISFRYLMILSCVLLTRHYDILVLGHLLCKTYYRMWTMWASQLPDADRYQSSSLGIKSVCSQYSCVILVLTNSNHSKITADYRSVHCLMFRFLSNTTFWKLYLFSLLDGQSFCSVRPIRVTLNQLDR